MKINRKFLLFLERFLLVLIALISIMLYCNRLPLIVSAVKDIQNTGLTDIRDYTPGECGLDSNRSPWLLETTTDYTKITPGVYIFQVQEKDANGNLSCTAVSHLKVLSPWYKTWWAFLLYVIGFVLLVFLVVKWRAIKLAQEKQKIEKIVEERTKEIKEKNQQLENENILLKEQSEKLKEMDKIKIQFIENLSTEFRNPLTLIMGPLEQMLANIRDPQQKKQLKMMHRNSQRLLNLINQISALFQISTGKMKLQASYRNIIPFLKGIISSFDMVAVQNGLNLEFHSEKEDISLYFDATKIEDAMYNLIINAVKFTPHGGRITVSVSVEQQGHTNENNLQTDFVKISVRDTGIGIPREELPHIFDRFFQGKDAHEVRGIGLALTEEIVLLHHGKIDVHSQEVKGTEFIIQLPLGNKQLKEEEL